MNSTIIFISVASNTTKKIPRTPKSPLDYLSNPNLDSFFISPCIAEEVSALMLSLKNSKSSGPNSIPVKFLKILNFSLLISLAVLTNESFLTGTFPKKLKD